jgi:hypothetical protein
MASERHDRKTNEHLDQTSADSFPASDPPAHSGVTGPGKPAPGPHRGDEERPTGTPTSNRHAQETSFQSEKEELPPQSNRDKPHGPARHKATPRRDH